ncbi:MAG: hypothetical protein K2J60_03435 [Acetatifactor sp.]|nr:hypothetical protein [Acetatifactor sp.]
MDIQIFDNFDEDGQLTLFGLEEDYEELRTSVRETAKDTASESMPVRPAQGKPTAGAGELRSKQPQSKEPVSGEFLSAEMLSGEQATGQTGAGIRIRSCSSCGKLLFVREEDGSYVSACNACGIQYIQK